MGFSTAEALLALGFKVTITCRSKEKCDEAVAALSKYKDMISSICMDMNDLSTVVAGAAAYADPALHVLVNNAGIMNTPFAMTKDGFEAQYQVNHLAHFQLIHLLMPKLRLGAAGGLMTPRVVNLSSRAHMRHGGAIDYKKLQSETAQSYDGWSAYGRSKLSNILCAKALAKRFPVATSGVAFVSLHPGLVATGLLTKGGMQRSAGMDIAEGIKCTIFLSTSPNVKEESGAYYQNDEGSFYRVTKENSASLLTEIAQNEAEADKCFDFSTQVLKIQRFGEQ